MTKKSTKQNNYKKQNGFDGFIKPRLEYIFKTFQLKTVK